TKLQSERLETLALLYTPGRYPLHALQMGSAYLVQMAPASTIINCAMLQAADQLLQRSEVVREFLAKQISVEGTVVSPVGSYGIIDGNLIPEGGQIRDALLDEVFRDRVIFLYHGELIEHKFGRF
ncbi:MAG: hypothetical protein DSY92_03575, partial [Planctomycetota bacterium]